MEERAKVVRHMWDVYAHSHSNGRLPRFWQQAFEAAYEELAGDDPASRDAAVAEIARLSMRMVDLEPPPQHPKVRLTAGPSLGWVRRKALRSSPSMRATVLIQTLPEFSKEEELRRKGRSWFGGVEREGSWNNGGDRSLARFLEEESDFVLPIPPLLQLVLGDCRRVRRGGFRRRGEAFCLTGDLWVRFPRYSFVSCLICDRRVLIGFNSFLIGYGVRLRVPRNCSLLGVL
ncbi:hypothetical protein BHE74_00014142 [Ensete ventricosum]|nr:hypothetical protein BHE74_00014142 [Ensete ventricosum]